MPTPAELVQQLHVIALQGRVVAVVWHVAVVAALGAIALGWRPARRRAAVLLALPLTSVAAAAWVFGNPFNGTVFVVLAVLVAALGPRVPAGRVSRGRAWGLALGGAMVVFGLVYPHFLGPGAALRYLYAAPTGLIPCPTLALVIGLTLLGDGLGSRALALALGLAGLFYGVFGVVRLGVRLDGGLIIGALGLLARALTPRAPAEASAPRGV